MSTLRQDIKEAITQRHGEAFAQRCLDHIDWIDNYSGYGAPGHMDYIIIQMLIHLLAEIYRDKK